MFIDFQIEHCDTVKYRKILTPLVINMNLKEKFIHFMAGRYGTDQFSRFLTFLALALIILNLFLRSSILWVLGLAALVVADIRMFSRNFEKRRKENERYLQLKYRLTGSARNWMDRQKQRRDYAFFRCPSCRAMLRVPRGKGRIRVTCRKCGNAFENKT